MPAPEYYAIGSDTLTFERVDPQPNMRNGIQNGREQYATDGSLIIDGSPYALWEYGYITVAQLTAINTLAGIGYSGTPSASVYVSLPNIAREWNWYTAIIEVPRANTGLNYVGNNKYAGAVYKLTRITFVE